MPQFSHLQKGYLPGGIFDDLQEHRSALRAALNALRGTMKPPPWSPPEKEALEPGRGGVGGVALDSERVPSKWLLLSS